MARLLALALALGIAGCGSLPEYALPRAEAVAPGAVRPADAIRYRAITRSDFRATAPPKAIGAHAASMGAYTCGLIVPEEPIAIRIEPTDGGWVARAPALRVHAEMDRSCSWWNAALRDAQPERYLLQHEQIHFALFELAAHELAARGRALAIRGESVEAAHAAFGRALERLRDDVTRKLVARSTDFDRDTSGVHRPDVQQRWFERVTAELARGSR